MITKINSKLKLNFGSFYTENFTFHIQKKSLDLAESKRIDYHWHDYFEMELIVSGNGTHYFDGNTFKTGRGSLYIISPVDFHKLEPNEDETLEIYTIKFDNNTVSSRIFKRILDVSPPLVGNLSGEQLNDVLSDLKLLEKEFFEKRPDSELLIRAVLEKLLLISLRNLEKTQKKSEIKPVSYEPSVQKAVSYLNYHFRGDISLRSVAEMLHLTPNYFGEIFKKNIGMSFTEYVKKLRLNYAYNLLINSNLNINQICYESGFNTISYFIDNFKKEYGETPYKFSKSQKAEKPQNNG